MIALVTLAQLKTFTDDQVHASAFRTAEESRKITLSLLRHLNEIDRRHLYSKFSVSSLHGYCVRHLKMDEAGAGRHVSAARLLREIPVIEEKIERGSMTLTSVSQAGVFFRKEAQAGHAFDLDSKRELVLGLEDKSTREVDRMLMQCSSNPEIHFKEKVIVKSEATTELRLLVDEETMVAINRLREVWSHAMPNASLGDILKRAARESVEKHDPVKKIARADERKVRTATKVQNLTRRSGKLASKDEENVPATVGVLAHEPTPAPECKPDVRRKIWKRDESQCTFVDPRTGDRCATRHFVEEDHVEPKAMGGAYTLENIRLRCRTHNQRHAIDSYGSEKMRPHIPMMN